jgi:ADP-dependent NAD(P)H-hydrate dehydratase / NAD(P)H-hydrate epimerase
MNNVVSAAQIKELDRKAVRAGIPAGDLMENAGKAVADAVIKQAPGENISIVAGKGGNGGDALVAARILCEAGYHVQAFTLSEIDELTQPARDKAYLLNQSFPQTLLLVDHSLANLRKALEEADCVIDGLLGIGVDRPLSGMYLDVIRAINSANVYRVAVDLPSGLPSDSGLVAGESLDAHLTVCMAAYKPAHLLYPARARCGKIEVIPVGYPDSLWESITPIARFVDKEWVAKHLPKRRPEGHKGTFGHVLVVAGSMGMSGAAILCATGALRAGAGLVTVACAGSIQPIIATAIPEAITIGLPEHEGHLTEKSVDKLSKAITGADVLAIGPGLGRADSTVGFVRAVLNKVTLPVVLDADGLYAVDADALGTLPKDTVFTPHPGEMSRLIARTANEINAERIEVAREFSLRNKIVLLLKGRPSTIATPEGEIILNLTGNTALACGGSGDVLTGMIAGFLAGGISTSNATIIGAYLHGYVAEHLSRDGAERSVIPSDLLRALPAAIAQVEGFQQ